jgi:hypothetical protein
MNQELKLAKAAYKAAKKNPVRFKEARDNLIMRIIESPIPKWGSLKFIVGKD